MIDKINIVIYDVTSYGLAQNTTCFMLIFKLKFQMLVIDRAKRSRPRVLKYSDPRYIFVADD